MERGFRKAETGEGMLIEAKRKRAGKEMDVENFILLLWTFGVVGLFLQRCCVELR